jgi:hypothetical protein
VAGPQVASFEEEVEFFTSNWNGTTAKEIIIVIYVYFKE